MYLNQGTNLVQKWKTLGERRGISWESEMKFELQGADGKNLSVQLDKDCVGTMGFWGNKPKGCDNGMDLSNPKAAIMVWMYVQEELLNIPLKRWNHMKAQWGLVPAQWEERR